MTDCLFCKIINGDIPTDIVFKDDKVIIFKDINPKADVHLLMIPREHIVSLNELADEHNILIAHMMRLLPTIAQDQGLESGFRTIINTGAGGGQEVFHLHVHLLGGRDLPGFS